MIVAERAQSKSVNGGNPTPTIVDSLKRRQEILISLIVHETSDNAEVLWHWKSD